jgi:hypothetical protein
MEGGDAVETREFASVEGQEGSGCPTMSSEEVVEGRVERVSEKAETARRLC